MRRPSLQIQRFGVRYCQARSTPADSAQPGRLSVAPIRGHPQRLAGVAHRILRESTVGSIVGPVWEIRADDSGADGNRGRGSGCFDDAAEITPDGVTVHVEVCCHFAVCRVEAGRQDAHEDMVWRCQLGHWSQFCDRERESRLSCDCLRLDDGCLRFGSGIFQFHWLGLRGLLMANVSGQSLTTSCFSQSKLDIKSRMI